MFDGFLLFAAESRRTAEEEDRPDGSSPSEVFYFVEFFPKEDKVHNCDEAEAHTQVKTLLMEDRQNTEIEEWIQVTNDKITFQRNVPVQLVTAKRKWNCDKTHRSPSFSPRII